MTPATPARFYSTTIGRLPTLREDNASLRLEANRQRRSGNSNFIGDMMFEAQQERLLIPALSARLSRPAESQCGPI